jgi:hypothetical protein
MGKLTTLTPIEGRPIGFCFMSLIVPWVLEVPLAPYGLNRLNWLDLLNAQREGYSSDKHTVCLFLDHEYKSNSRSDDDG